MANTTHCLRERLIAYPSSMWSNNQEILSTHGLPKRTIVPVQGMRLALPPWAVHSAPWGPERALAIICAARASSLPAEVQIHPKCRDSMRRHPRYSRTRQGASQSLFTEEPLLWQSAQRGGCFFSFFSGVTYSQYNMLLWAFQWVSPVHVPSPLIIKYQTSPAMQTFCFFR